MRFWHHTFLDVLFLIFGAYVLETHAQGCTMKDSCTCSMDDGSGDIALTSLSRNDGTAAFADLTAPDGYIYSYNPCNAFYEAMCSNAAACQQTADRVSSFTIGDANSAQFSFDGLNVHLSYTGDDGRQSDVTLVCDPNSDGSVVADGEISPLIYTFTLTSKCACPGVCGGSAPTPGPTPNPNPDGPGGDSSGEGLSIGTILCIAVLAVAVVYVISGMTFQKVKNQATGKEVIPNVTFWQTLPGLIKDGFAFTFGKCRPSAYRSI